MVVEVVVEEVVEVLVVGEGWLLVAVQVVVVMFYIG